MAPSRSDLDWLYRRDENDDDATRQMPPADDTPAAVNPPQRGRQSFVEEPAAEDPRRRQSYLEDPAQTRMQPPVAEPEPEPQRPVRPTAAPGGRGSGRPPGPPPTRPEPSRPRKRRRRRPVRSFFLILLVLILALGGYLIGVPMVAWNSATKIEAMPTGERPGDQPGTTYLLVGSDSREGLTPEEQRRLGTGRTEGQRTDTMMLLFVPRTGKPALISLPRDLYVPIPGQGENKLNAAYSFGGPQLLVQTVEQSTGVRIDKYIEVGFGGFVNVIDALGGIEMCLDEPIQDRDSHLDLPAGCQQMDGPTALGYVRMRKADPRGDLGRVERQREMLSQIAKKSANPMNVLIPTRYWNLSKAGASSLSVDRKTGATDAGRMAKAFLDVSRGSGLTLTVPIADPNYSTNAGSAVLWDEAGAKEMFGKIASGSTEGLEKFAGKP
ncbi:LCP family protein [Enemella sp. A6]|uniref:LCP family protein n=1 Tax=Enemella sp. A6 TaxID=3440152 RepID=UPI003EBB4142